MGREGIKDRIAQGGWTLLEMLVVLGIAAALAVLAVPGLRQFAIVARLDSAADGFMTALHLARSEAIQRNARVILRNLAGGGNWGSGWVMCVDANANNLCDAAETVLRRGETLAAPLSLYANVNYTNFIRFYPDGQVKASTGSFVLCHDGVLVEGGVSRSRGLIVSAGGRVRYAPDSNGNGIPEKAEGDFASCTNP